MNEWMNDHWDWCVCVCYTASPWSCDLWLFLQPEDPWLCPKPLTSALQRMRESSYSSVCARSDSCALFTTLLCGFGLSFVSALQRKDQTWASPWWRSSKPAHNPCPLISDWLSAHPSTETVRERHPGTCSSYRDGRQTRPPGKNYNSQNSACMDVGLRYIASMCDYLLFSLLRDRPWEYFLNKLAPCEVTTNQANNANKAAARAVTADNKKQNSVRCLTCSCEAAGEFQSERFEELGAALCPARRCSSFTSDSTSAASWISISAQPPRPRAHCARARPDTAVAWQRGRGSHAHRGSVCVGCIFRNASRYYCFSFHELYFPLLLIDFKHSKDFF